MREQQSKVYCKLCGDTGWKDTGYTVERCRGPNHLMGEITKLADQNLDNPDVQRLTAEARTLLHQYCGDGDMVPLPWIADEGHQQLWDAAVKAFVKATEITERQTGRN